MPDTTRISGFAVLLMLFACFWCMVLGDRLLGRPGAWLAGFLFFGYMGTANWWYAKDLFLGRGAARRGDFPRAKEHLEAAVARFEATPLVDRFRWLLLFSPTGSRFRESAHLALAHCHVLSGSPEMFDAFERCAREFPKSRAANSSLMLLRVGARIGARGGHIDLDDAA